MILGRISGPAIVVVVIMLFGTGMAYGGHVATDDSRSLDAEQQNFSSDMMETSEQTQNNISANTSAYVAKPYNAVVDSIFRITTSSFVTGMGIGHPIPTLGKVGGHAITFGSLIGYLLYVAHRLTSSV